MKICPSCQKKFPDDALSCSQCGARLMLDTSGTIPEPKQFLIGKVIAGNYRVERLLGQGGMGAVFQARQLSLNRNVAVKVLLAPLAMDREMLERFQREAQAASNIGHPGIVQVIDMGYLPEGPPFMVMELIEGEDLRQKLQREGAFSVNLAIPVIIQVCDALQAAHDKGIVHRDLKPDNIFLTYRSGKVPLIKLLDFGLSKIKGAGRKLTNTGALMGTPNYMSPEQVKADREVDHRTDIYALGSILYEMVTGRMAYDGPSVQNILVSIMTQDPPTPRMARPDLPAALEAVVLKAMARNPDHRFQTMNEMAVELAKAGSYVGVPSSQLTVVSTPAPRSMPVPTPSTVSAPVTPPALQPPPKKSRLGLVIGLLAAGCFTVLAAGVAIVFMFIYFGPPKPPQPPDFVLNKMSQEKVDLEGLSFEDDDEEDEESGMPATAVPGIKLGNGTNPYLCCNKKSCGLVYQRESNSGLRVYFRKLDKNMSPETKPLPLTPKSEQGSLPVCFARDDGGFLVLYQEPVEIFDNNSKGFSVDDILKLKLHWVVITPKGTAGKKQTTTINSMMAMDIYQRGFVSSKAEDKIMVVWSDPNSTLKAALFDMNGKKIKSDFLIHGKYNHSIGFNSVACGPKSCLILWTKSSASLSNISQVEMLSIISPSGKIVEKEKKILDKGLVAENKVLLPLSDGAAMLWIGRGKDGNEIQMMAQIDWNGDLIAKPKRIKGLVHMSSSSEQVNFASSSPDGKTIVITHPTSGMDSDYDPAVVVVVGRQGNVAARKMISYPDEDIEDSAVFFAAAGRPVIFYQVDTFEENPPLYAYPLKPKIKK